MKRLIILLMASISTGPCAVGDDGVQALPVLRDECFRCHDDKKQKGGLRLDSREAMLRGGDTGPGLVPGKRAESLIYELLAAEADPHMPPKGQLAAAQIEAVGRWIDGGAAWDETVLVRDGSGAAGEVSLEAYPEVYRPVLDLALSPGGELLAVAVGNRIEVLDVTADAARRVAVLEGHRDAVQSLAWSPDGKALASGGFRQVLVWEAGLWERVARLEAPLRGRVTGLIFAGNRLVTADSVPAVNGLLHLWDLHDFRHAATIGAHRDTIFDLGLSPDGLRAVTVSADRTVRLWDARTWEAGRTLEGHTGYVLAAEFSPEGGRLATAGDDETIKVWDLETLKQIHGFTDRLPTGAVTGLIWSRDPSGTQKAAVASGDGEEPPPDWIVAVSEDGKPRAYTKLQVHDGTQRSGGATARAWEESGAALNAVVWMADRQVLAAGTVGGEVLFWTAAGKRMVMAP